MLVRRLRELGFECEMMASSLIPLRASERVKADRRAAREAGGSVSGGGDAPGLGC